MPFDLKLVFKPNEDIVFDEVGQGFVLVHPFNDESHELDELGSLIWKGIIDEKPLSEILRWILDGYDVDSDKAKQDLFDFLNELNEKGLVAEA